MLARFDASLQDKNLLPSHLSEAGRDQRITEWVSGSQWAARTGQGDAHPYRGGDSGHVQQFSSKEGEVAVAHQQDKTLVAGSQHQLHFVCPAERQLCPLSLPADICDSERLRQRFGEKTQHCLRS